MIILMNPDTDFVKQFKKQLKKIIITAYAKLKKPQKPNVCVKSLSKVKKKDIVNVDYIIKFKIK